MEDGEERRKKWKKKMEREEKKRKKTRKKKKKKKERTRVIVKRGIISRPLQLTIGIGNHDAGSHASGTNLHVSV